MRIGNSDAVTIPAGWRSFIEEKTGKKLQFVGMEIDGKGIRIIPVLMEENKNKHR